MIKPIRPEIQERSKQAVDASISELSDEATRYVIGCEKHVRGDEGYFFAFLREGG